MDKKVSVWILVGAIVATLILAPKLRQLPLVNKIPTA